MDGRHYVRARRTVTAIRSWLPRSPLSLGNSKIALHGSSLLQCRPRYRCLHRILACRVVSCVAVYCSVLQCVAVCCSASHIGLSCSVVCCSVLQRVVVCCSVLQCVAVHRILACLVVSCVAVYCSVL